MKATVVCSMRNEGPFLVEWVCWYRMLGFTDLVIVTNDCTDHSPELLDHLARAGWVHHLRSDVVPGEKVVAAKLKQARRHPAVRRADWVLVCDVDEFLVIHRGAGKLADLLAPHLAESGPDMLAMAINWRVFGTSGIAEWQDGLTHRQFRRAGPTRNWISRWIKVLHRAPLAFGALGEHGPKRLSADKAAPPLRFVNSEGVTVPDWSPEGPYLRMLPADLTTHEVAQMNHYMLRSEESWGLKQGTPSAVQGADRYNDSYYRSTNRNELRDLSALRHEAAFDLIHAEAMALPGVRRLHHLCCADYAARLCDKAGRAVETDARWRWHMAQAGEA
ncbi:glycosyltransferase family 2 protein [Gemmobacter fulvus]|uniref:Glycosyltransferase family 2 protein n=1 Tax=Gemmobacter fulvus TaxID=2840474 RepID=A0A975S088_9RHOB|nr:glycosyltransferase family 2 protein [Gemmobacter fulvus]MBT9247104.1 glycosyltransferase family 2 protein [Gemmobacter fulvus]QWK89869.1 glycosyltransferase family 2 protein [Gemmobacter fulvus]